MNAEILAHEALSWIVRAAHSDRLEVMREDVIAYFKSPLALISARKKIDPSRHRGKFSGEIFFAAMREYFVALAERLTRERIEPQRLDIRFVKLRPNDRLLIGLSEIATNLRRTVEEMRQLIANDETMPVSLHSGIYIALRRSLGPWRKRAESATRKAWAQPGDLDRAEFDRLAGLAIRVARLRSRVASLLGEQLWEERGKITKWHRHRPFAFDAWKSAGALNQRPPPRRAASRNHHPMERDSTRPSAGAASTA